jgi:HlyD family secretion protein
MNRRLATFLMIFLSGCSGAPELKGVRAVATRVETTVSSTSSGKIEATQQAVLGFGISGRVERVLVKVGEAVVKGRILAELENRDLKSIQDNAERDVKRAKELFQADLVSRVVLDDARKALEIAGATLDKTVIRAPFAGVVTEQNLEVGELFQPAVSGGKAPLTLVDYSKLLVKGNIDELDLSKVKEGSRARVRVPAVRQQPFQATVTRRVPFVSTTREQDRISEIELKLEPEGETVPVGASADIEVIVETKESALAVPSRLILGRGENRYLYVEKSGKLERRNVKLGVGNYDRTEILSGVTAGDDVVMPPDNIELKDGLRVKVDIQPWP